MRLLSDRFCYHAREAAWHTGQAARLGLLIAWAGLTFTLWRFFHWVEQKLLPVPHDKP